MKAAGHEGDMHRDDNHNLKVLFVCTGNACRSQMAEAWARHLKADVIDPYSAGVRPAGRLSQTTVAVMEQAGVSMEGLFSKGIDYWAGLTFDYVVVLCDYAYRCCPAFPETTRIVCRPFPDPTQLLGPPERLRGAFLKVRDQIRDFVMTLPESLPDLWRQTQVF